MVMVIKLTEQLKLSNGKDPRLPLCFECFSAKFREIGVIGLESALRRLLFIWSSLGSTIEPLYLAV
jgi:hypothetical protein